MKDSTLLFNHMLSLLKDNVFPSLINSLQEMEIDLCHMPITIEHSKLFFEHLNMEFPFNINNMLTEHYEHVAVLSIYNNGQISLSESYCIIENIIELREEIVFSNNISDFFTPFPVS